MNVQANKEQLSASPNGKLPSIGEEEEKLDKGFPHLHSVGKLNSVQDL